MNSTIVKASELVELVRTRLADLRDPDRHKRQAQALRKYEQRLSKGAKEIEIRSGMLGESHGPGFYAISDAGKPVATLRPKLVDPPLWGYSGHDRGSFGFTHHARQFGLLSEPKLNRNIRPQRVEEYREAMNRGEWRDLLSDPIAITEEGDVVNGQHRLAAAAQVNWSKVENDPTFLVLFGVGETESLYADGSRRTTTDERTIAVRLAESAG